MSQVIKNLLRFLVAIWSIFVIIPLIYLFYDTVIDQNILNIIGSALDRRDIWKSTGVSFLNSLVCSTISTLMSFFCAYFLLRKKYSNLTLYFLVIYLPIFIPTLPIAISSRALVGVFGVYTGYLLPSIFHVTIASPFCFAIFYYHLSYISPNIEAAALNLGAQTSRVMYDILLPIMTPSFLMSFAFSFLISWDEMVYSRLLSGFSDPLSVLIRENLWSSKDEALVFVSISFSMVSYLAILSILSFRSNLLERGQ